MSSRKTKHWTPRLCRRSRCQLVTSTLPYLIGSPGRQGSKVTPTSYRRAHGLTQRRPCGGPALRAFRGEIASALFAAAAAKEQHVECEGVAGRLPLDCRY